MRQADLFAARFYNGLLKPMCVMLSPLRRLILNPGLPPLTPGAGRALHKPFFTESRFARSDNRHRPIGYLQFREDARDVILHGFNAQAEPAGDIAIVVPLRNQIQDFAFPLGQLSEFVR